MTALLNTVCSFQVGLFRGVHGSKKHTFRLMDRCLRKRNYQLPVAVFEGEIKLKKTDRVALDSEIIYRVPKPKRLSIVAIVFNVKVVLMPAVLYIIYGERNGIFSFYSDRMLDLMSQNVLFLTETQCYGLGLIGMLFSVVMNRYLCFHPLRIYGEKNSTKFTAIYLNSFFPWRTKKHEFTTVKRSFKSVFLGKRLALIEEVNFKTPAHQIMLYGHTKYFR